MKYLPSCPREKTNNEFEVAISHDNEYLIAKCGVGKNAASQCTEYIINKYSNEISFVISVGIAGALSPALDIGDIVVGDTIVDFSEKSMREFRSHQKPKMFLSDNSIYFGKVLCSDDIINDRTLREQLFEQHGVLCVEMESAGVAEKCIDRNIPFIVVKVISDHADGQAIISMMRTQHKIMDKLGRFLTVHVGNFHGSFNAIPQ